MRTSIKRIFRSETGFTLVELLVVIAVLGILAGIAVPRLTGVQNRAKDAAIASIAGGIKTAMSIYHVENDGYPDSTVIDTTDTWGDMVTALDTVELGEMADHNISAVTYAADVDDNEFLFTFTSATGGRVYYLGEKGYGDTETEATTINDVVTTP